MTTTRRFTYLDQTLTATPDPSGLPDYDTVMLASGEVFVLTPGAGPGGVAAFLPTPVGVVADNHQTGTAYTLALSDMGRVVSSDNASPVTVTIPAHSAVAFPVGAQVMGYQAGAGQVTVAPDTGVTLRSPHGAHSVGQYSTYTLRQVALDEWVISGDVTV